MEALSTANHNLLWLAFHLVPTLLSLHPKINSHRLQIRWAPSSEIYLCIWSHWLYKSKIPTANFETGNRDNKRHCWHNKFITVKSSKPVIFRLLPDQSYRYFKCTNLKVAVSKKKTKCTNLKCILSSLSSIFWHKNQTQVKVKIILL